MCEGGEWAGNERATKMDGKEIVKLKGGKSPETNAAHSTLIRCLVESTVNTLLCAARVPERGSSKAAGWARGEQAMG